MNDIRLENVTKLYRTAFRTTRALNHVNLAIKEGEFLAIKGKSGSGKSTLLKLVAGIMACDEGHIYVNGKDLTIFHEKEVLQYRREMVGIVFQSFELLPYHNVMENILLPMHLNHYEVQKEQVHKMLRALEIEHLIDSFPDELSGGEQQRVAIARALIHQPPILLLDEPTGNLDSENSLRFMQMLKALYEIQKPTILLVTHDDEVASYAQREIILKDGTIIDQSN